MYMCYLYLYLYLSLSLSLYMYIYIYIYMYMFAPLRVPLTSPHCLPSIPASPWLVPPSESSYTYAVPKLIHMCLSAHTDIMYGPVATAQIMIRDLQRSAVWKPCLEIRHLEI